MQMVKVFASSAEACSHLKTFTSLKFLGSFMGILFNLTPPWEDGRSKSRAVLATSPAFCTDINAVSAVSGFKEVPRKGQIPLSKRCKCLLWFKVPESSFSMCGFSICGQYLKGVNKMPCKSFSQMTEKASFAVRGSWTSLVADYVQSILVLASAWLAKCLAPDWRNEDICVCIGNLGGGTGWFFFS